jgi:hypothetical protein
MFHLGFFSSFLHIHNVYLNKYNMFKDAGDSTFNQNLRQLTVFLFIAII